VQNATFAHQRAKKVVAWRRVTTRRVSIFPPRSAGKLRKN